MGSPAWCSVMTRGVGLGEREGRLKREGIYIYIVMTDSNQSILKEINPEYSLEGLVLKLKLQYFGHLMQRADSLEKTLMLGKFEGKKRRE